MDIQILISSRGSCTLWDDWNRMTQQEKSVLVQVLDSKRKNVLVGRSRRLSYRYNLESIPFGTSSLSIHGSDCLRYAMLLRLPARRPYRTCAGTGCAYCARVLYASEPWCRVNPPIKIRSSPPLRSRARSSSPVCTRTCTCTSKRDGSRQGGVIAASLLVGR